MVRHGSCSKQRQTADGGFSRLSNCKGRKKEFRARHLSPGLLRYFLAENIYSNLMSANNQMPCDFCQRPYDPIATRWLCPHCHMKTNCCDGAPCPMPDVAEISMSSNGRNELAGS